MHTSDHLFDRFEHTTACAVLHSDSSKVSNSSAKTSPCLENLDRLLGLREKERTVITRLEAVCVKGIADIDAFARELCHEVVLFRSCYLDPVGMVTNQR